MKSLISLGLTLPNAETIVLSAEVSATASALV